VYDLHPSFVIRRDQKFQFREILGDPQPLAYACANAFNVDNL